MRARARCTRAAMIVGVCVAGLAFGVGRASTPHGPPQAATDDFTPRGLYITKKADAIRVQVLDAKSGAPVLPNQKFKNGDRLSVLIESNFNGYVYVINVEQSGSGEKRILGYPNPCARDNELKPNDRQELSAAFDEKPGTEILQVIMSHEPIGELDSAASGDCASAPVQLELDAQRSALVASLAGRAQNSTAAQTAGGVFPLNSGQKPNESGLRTRDIELAPGKDKDKTSKYLAVPLKAGSDGRLKGKEVFMFEIRLQHVQAGRAARAKTTRSQRSKHRG